MDKTSSDKAYQRLVDNGVEDTEDWLWAFGELTIEEFRSLSSYQKLERLKEAGAAVPI